MSPPGPEAMADLRAEMGGPLLVPGDAAFADEVAGFNAAVHHTPPVVAGAVSAADVQAVVRWAARWNVPVAVQATGHGAVTPVRSGVLITTHRMDGVRIDPAQRTATVGAGVRWRAVIDAAAVHGLAPLNGSASDVGVVGYTLGGGLPVMGRTFGFAADTVERLELVTASGDRLQVDATSEPELFWAARGGSGNVGIVTEMTVRLMPVAEVYGGGIFWAGEHAADVFHAYRQWVQDLDEATNSSVAVLRLPPLPEVPEPLRGRPVAHLRVCHVGDHLEGARRVERMRAVAPALIDDVGPMPYREVDRIHRDPEHPIPILQRGELLARLDAGTVDALLGAAGPQVDIPVIICELRHLGGALGRPRGAPAAIGGRHGAFSLTVVGLAAPPVASAAATAIEEIITAVAPWSCGATIVNLHGASSGEADRARAWDAPTYDRLVALVRRVDPAGILRPVHAIGR